MKKGRRKDHIWQFVKYKGDVAFYAKCRCGFRYPCYASTTTPFRIKIAPDKLYPYCPLCGSRKTRYIDDVLKIDKYPWE